MIEDCCPMCANSIHGRFLTALTAALLATSTSSLIAANPADASAQNQKSAEETWWSLKPLQKPAPPSISSGKYKNWPRTPIDQFILAKLLQKGFQPSAQADKHTLLRRVYFDLTGLPPRPEEVTAF